jgi:hypothetical protein
MGDILGDIVSAGNSVVLNLKKKQPVTRGNLDG